MAAWLVLLEMEHVLEGILQDVDLASYQECRGAYVLVARAQVKVIPFAQGIDRMNKALFCVPGAYGIPRPTEHMTASLQHEYKI